MAVEHDAGESRADDTTVWVRSHGAVVELRCPSGVLEAAQQRFAPGVTVDRLPGPPDTTVVVDTDARTITSEALGTSVANDADELIRLTASVVQLHLAAHATEAVFVHAGVVAHRGHAIVVPGRSHAGKTSLVQALVEAGATYYSDEYAVLDDDGHVEPYAKPLSVRVDGAASVVLPASELGEVGTEAVPVALVAALTYDADLAGSDWSPTTERGAAVALPLVENTVPAQLRPVDTLDAVTGVARRAAMVRGPRPDAAAAAPVLLALVDELLDGSATPAD